jgi:hypothetical protein
VQKKLIVRRADRPDLMPIVAQWLWHEWWHQDGHALEQPDPGCGCRLPGCRHPGGLALDCRCRARVRACWVASEETVHRHGRRSVTLMRRDLTSRDLDP